MSAPQVGTVLRSRYSLRQQLGKNATRQTWLAVDREQDCTVVVKMLAFNLQLQWQEVKLFEREAQALQKLDHPRIPKYLDYFTIEGKPDWIVLVQSYVPGESLQAQLDRGMEFDEERLRQIATVAWARHRSSHQAKTGHINQKRNVAQISILESQYR